MQSVAIAVTNVELFALTIDLHVGFMRPAKPGPISALAQITDMRKQFAFLEGELFDTGGKLCVRATASSVPVKVDPREVY
jgi:uncharacterized protein (TIGR00369 family)